MKCERCDHLWMKHLKWMRPFYMGVLRMKMPKDVIGLARDDLKRMHKRNEYGKHTGRNSNSSNAPN